jgi:hypothetical protein
MAPEGKMIESERIAMNTINPQRSLTLGQIELYLLFAFALSGLINKALQALTRSRGHVR